MGKVVLDVTISLDGVMAVLDQYRLHDWYFHSNSKTNSEVIQNLIENSGAIIMGRTMYDLGDKFDGFINNPYQVPHFVLTHSKPERLPKGNTEFIFISNSLQSALEQAKKAAGKRYVTITGGVSIARQFLKTGLIDEMHLHVVPVLLGSGQRLFDQIDGVHKEWECTEVKNSIDVTHLSYRFAKL
jgi:dihydrofolate reductase